MAEYTEKASAVVHMPFGFIYTHHSNGHTFKFLGLMAQLAHQTQEQIKQQLFYRNIIQIKVDDLRGSNRCKFKNVGLAIGPLGHIYYFPDIT